MAGNGISPESRFMRLVIIPLLVAGGILFKIRPWIPQPWRALQLLERDTRAMILHQPFFVYLGRDYPPGTWVYHAALEYLDRGWVASLAVAGSVAVGIVVGLIADTIAVKLATRHNVILTGRKRP